MTPVLLRGPFAQDSPGVKVKRGLRLNMANNPKKVKDPTEVALSAIQEALNISDTTVDSSRNSISNEMAPPPISSAAPSYSETPYDGRDTRSNTDRVVFDQIEEPRASRRPANDDRETIGQILQAIHKGRPARR